MKLTNSFLRLSVVYSEQRESERSNLGWSRHGWAVGDDGRPGMSEGDLPVWLLYSCWLLTGKEFLLLTRGQLPVS